MNRPWPDIQINVMTIEPVAARAGYAPHEDRVVIQLLLSNDEMVTFALDPDTAYTLCSQIADIGSEIADIAAIENEPTRPN